MALLDYLNIRQRPHLRWPVPLPRNPPPNDPRPQSAQSGLPPIPNHRVHAPAPPPRDSAHPTAHVHLPRLQLRHPLDRPLDLRPLWTTYYHQSTSHSGLHYLALVLGCTIAAQIGSPLTDHIYASLTRRSNGTSTPEFRVPLILTSLLLIPAGLLIYGWTAEYCIFWVVPDVGMAVFGCGIVLGMQAMQVYVMDSFGEWTASAVAASQMLRRLAAFGFPILRRGCK